MAEDGFSENTTALWSHHISRREILYDDLFLLTEETYETKQPTPQNDHMCYQWTVYTYVTIPLQIIAIVANILVVYVWNAETKHHTTTYVFKTLAITDILMHAITTGIARPLNSYADLHPSRMHLTILYRASNSGIRRANVYVSLLLALVRLVKVSPGLSSEHIFSRAKLRVYVCVIFLWVFFLETFSTLAIGSDWSCYAALLLRGETKTADRLHIAEMVMTDHVGYSIPAFLQMVVMIIVIVKVRKHLSERAAGICAEVDKAMRRLDYTIFCICGFTFFIHCVLRLAVTAAKMKTTVWNSTLRNLFLVINMGQAINSLINVFFYAMFVPRFRELAKKRVACLSLARTSPIALGDSTVFPAATKIHG